MTTVSKQHIAECIIQFIIDRLGIPDDEIDVNENLGSYGLSSMQAVHLIGSLEEFVGFPLTPTLVYQYPSVHELAQGIDILCQTQPGQQKPAVVVSAAPITNEQSCYQAVAHLSVIEALALRSEAHADRILFRFLGEQGQEEDSVTYAELWRRVKVLAAHLCAYGKDGDRIALFYPAGLEFIAAFLACLLARRVAVPLNMPTKRRVERCVRILTDCDCRLALSLESIIPSLQAIFSDSGDQLNWISSDFAGSPQTSAQPGTSDSLLTTTLPLPAADATLAFLQYTSGSTSHPKGVCITQLNISTNLRMMRNAWELDHTSTTIFWQPHHHDMGLILGQLLPLILGNETILMGPNTFVRQPLLWLEVISRYRAVLAGGPNFAYELCVQRYGQGKLIGCDLSSWKIALNGADVVRAGTLDCFAATFAASGYSPATMLPCYGLAEATLFVSGGPVGRIPDVMHVDAHVLERQGRVQLNQGTGSKAVVSCGLPSNEIEVVIVDPVTCKRKDINETGEIWLSGTTNATTYWNLPELSQQKLQAQIAESDSRHYIRTGDIGFIGQQNGHLYICGRLKDLIIVEGRNVHPEDIEYAIVQCEPLFKSQSCAVFENEQARIVAVIETDRELKRKLPAFEKELKLKIRRTVSEEHGISIADVVFIAPATMSKTTSGKIQRGVMRQRYISDELVIVDPAVIDPAVIDPLMASVPEPVTAEAQA